MRDNSQSLRVVALISGGKDSTYNMVQCTKDNHQIIALANLYPESTDELDSYMYQSVGHEIIKLYAEAIDIPLYRAIIKGNAKTTEKYYSEPVTGDEVEDLYQLLCEVKKHHEFDAVSVGAIFSEYQYNRVANVCHRLNIKVLTYLWKRDQKVLLDEMIDNGIEAIIIKTAAMGLYPQRHLGKTLVEMRPILHNLSEKYGINICGEGGEYETLTLDCSLFKKRIVIDHFKIVLGSADVGYLKVEQAHLEDKSDGL